MRRRSGFGNSDNVSAANGPAERNGGGRTTVRGADLCERAITCQQVVVAAERGIRHHRHIVLLAPRQKVTLDLTVLETVRDLIGYAVMAVRNAEEFFHLARAEVGYAPGANLS